MKTERMVRMANQIAVHFSSYPDDDAAHEVAQHLKQFWAPPMVRQIVAYAAEGGVDLHHLVKKAVVLLN